MGILVALAMAQAFRARVAGVAQVLRHRQRAPRFDILQRRINGQ